MGLRPRVVCATSARIGGFVLVDRTSEWGNHAAWRAGLVRPEDREEAVRIHRLALAERMMDQGYRDYLRRSLKGRVLACWCKRPPCHAHALLAAANDGGLLD